MLARSSLTGTLGSAFALAEWAWLPLHAWSDLDVYEGPDAYTYLIPVHGLRKRDLAIEVRDRVVRICGERTEGFFRPRAVRSLVRCFTLPDAVDESAVSADVRDGVLVIAAPKKPSARARRIPIRVANAPANDTLAALPSVPMSGWWPRLRDAALRWFGGDRAKEVAS